MKRAYTISDNGLQKSEDENIILEVYHDPSEREREQFIEDHNFPEDLFDFDDMPHVAPRIEVFSNKEVGHTLFFVFSNIFDVTENSEVEKRLESHTFILKQKKLFWFMNHKSSNLDQELLEEKGPEINSLQSIILNAALLSYTHFTAELEKQKKIIDHLNDQAISSTSRQVLIDVSNSERNLVMLQHTIDTQEEAFRELLDNEEFIQNLNNPHLVHDIKWYNRQVKKLINVYRDLLDSVSSLFSDIMSNNLNKLMKFLSSLSLIIAASSLIGDLWGMNTGGLPFEQHKYGTLIMIGVTIFACVAMYLFLKNKEYFDD